jgi:hypothetical protein
MWATYAIEVKWLGLVTKTHTCGDEGAQCTAPSCPVHRHPSGGDRLAEAESSVLGAGTATPRWCPPRRGQGEPVLGLAMEVAVCTAIGATVVTPWILT